MWEDLFAPPPRVALEPFALDHDGTPRVPFGFFIHRWDDWPPSCRMAHGRARSLATAVCLRWPAMNDAVSGGGEGKGRPVHAWCLVLEGRRPVGRARGRSWNWTECLKGHPSRAPCCSTVLPIQITSNTVNQSHPVLPVHQRPSQLFRIPDEPTTSTYQIISIIYNIYIHINESGSI